MIRTAWFILGWIFVRPRRWFFWRMVCATSPRWWFERDWCDGWRWPNIHWWILYKTVYRPLIWLNWNSYKLRKFPTFREIVYRIARTTAGFAQNGGECFHCAYIDGDPASLSEDEGESFKLLRTWSVGTMDGTDHRFEGITTCPRCGYESHYEDGSL